LKIGIGTAQFGFPYGISNTFGQPDSEEVARIICTARQGGIKIIDTAHEYGESETALGKCPELHRNFNIVTKTLPLGKKFISGEDVDRAITAFHLSLERLCQPSVYALLVHHAGDLLAKDADRLMEALLILKSQHLIQKVGVSVYDQRELDAVITRFPVDIVQLPFSVLDQRLLANGSLASLKHAGVEVHARSVFLQGLLFMDPDSLGEYFLAAQGALRRLRAFAHERGQTPLEIALRFVTNRDEVDCAIVGISRHEELEEIIAAYQTSSAIDDYSGFAVHDDAILNPARWPH
jgi:aryl-alcohol dehydrogenase-like predicted oxidoreductase